MASIELNLKSKSKDDLFRLYQVVDKNIFAFINCTDKTGDVRVRTFDTWCTVRDAIGYAYHYNT